jgi:hypothetical protein
MTVTYRTYVEYDATAGIWFTEASTIPGLGASSADIDQVVTSLNALAPVMLQENVYRRPDRTRPIDYEGPSEVEHEIVVIGTDGRAHRTQPARISVLSLL